MMQATGSSFFTQAMALATANTASTALPELLAFMTSRLGQQRANALVQKVGHLLTLEQQYTLQETYLYGSSRLGVKNQNTTLSTRIASVQNGSLTPIGNAILNTDSVFTGTAAVYGLPKAPTARVFNRTWGLKQYELSNHLGNVQVTISDKKLGVAGANQEDFIAYEPEVKSATDYYAYVMEMPGKTYQSTAYRYGMNTQEKDNEIYGPGNTLGALYWEYDARIARRWNVDPVVVPSLSNYHAFEGNPIIMVDPLGNSAGIFKKDPNTGKEKKVSTIGDKEGFDVVLTGPSNEDGSMNQQGVTTEVYELVDGARGNKIAGENNIKNDAAQSEGGVGQPSSLESMIPIWGSGRAAVDHFQNGNYGWAAFHTALAVSDVLLVKSIATGIGKGAWKLGSHSWKATRKWMGKKGYAETGQPVHHWAVSQSSAKKYGIEGLTNQPWNLMTFPNQSLHIRAGHGMKYLDKPGFNAMGQFWYGTPTWFKSGLFSSGGRIVD